MRALVAGLLFIGTSSLAFADHPNHECSVRKTVQVYNAETVRLESVSRFQTQWFQVTKAPHENPYNLPLTGENGSADGTVSVWTGTLPKTPDGDVIQSNLRFRIQDRDEEANLVMSVASPVAFTVRSFENALNGKLYMTTVELKCRQKQE